MLTYLVHTLPVEGINYQSITTGLWLSSNSVAVSHCFALASRANRSLLLCLPFVVPKWTIFICRQHTEEFVELFTVYAKNTYVI